MSGDLTQASEAQLEMLWNMQKHDKQAASKMTGILKGQLSSMTQ